MSLFKHPQPEIAPAAIEQPELSATVNIDDLRGQLFGTRARLNTLIQSQRTAQREVDHEKDETRALLSRFGLERHRPDRDKIKELESRIEALKQEAADANKTIADLVQRIERAEREAGISASERIARVSDDCKCRIGRLEELAAEMRQVEESLYGKMVKLRTMPFAREEDKALSEREFVWLGEQVVAMAVRYRMVVNPSFGSHYDQQWIPNLPEAEWFYSHFKENAKGAAR